MMTKNPLLKVVAAEYVSNYTLRLTFSTGEVRLVDFTPLMQKGICRKLQDLDYFKSFRLDPFTVMKSVSLQDFCMKEGLLHNNNDILILPVE